MPLTWNTFDVQVEVGVGAVAASGIPAGLQPALTRWNRVAAGLAAARVDAVLESFALAVGVTQGLAFGDTLVCVLDHVVAAHAACLDEMVPCAGRMTDNSA